MSKSTAESTVRYFVNRDDAGRVRYNGVDKGGTGTVIAENDEVLVVEWPAGKHWVGRGMTAAYDPASMDVLEKNQDGRFTLLISWKKRRLPARKTAIRAAAE